MNNNSETKNPNLETIELFVFDMAGTTVKEDNLVYKTVREAINEQGFNVSLQDCLEYGAGKEKQQAIIDIIQAKSDCDDNGVAAKKAFLRFQTLLKQAYNAQTIQPFAGMLDFFNELRTEGKKVVLNTGYDRETANKIITLLDWQVGRDIDELICADDVDNGRPHPDMIELAMVRCDIDNKRAVLKAGDSVIDIEEGQNAGCGITVAVLSGAQTRAQLEKANPDYIVNQLTDLRNL